ncbi:MULTISPECIES: hypothetical protein [Halomonadaceae]|uniref:hypothetical protein n=1 Tax=Halomonadaceae TaxID=28256 RepID=UPI003FD6F9B2
MISSLSVHADVAIATWNIKHLEERQGLSGIPRKPSPNAGGDISGQRDSAAGLIFTHRHL